MTPPVTPWYRQAWPWFLISLPATAVVAGSFTFYLAARDWDGPVAQDYYKQGLAINEELSRSTKAKDLGVAANLSFGGLSTGDRVRVAARGPHRQGDRERGSPCRHSCCQRRRASA